jgi:hypothetical protein
VAKLGGEKASSMRSSTRSETMTPSMVSAGQVAHQPTTMERRRSDDSMFQIAGTRRMAEETGTSPWAVASTNPVMPCTGGRTPVATVLQITGDDAQLVMSTAREPSRASARSVGKRSWRHSSSITFQSAPSTPNTIMGWGLEGCAPPPHERHAHATVAASARAWP